MVAAAMAVSCNKEAEAPVESKPAAGPRTFTLAIGNPEARVSVDEAGKTAWEAGDALYLYDGSVHTTVELTADSISDDGKTATITVDGFEGDIYAAYPASSVVSTTADGVTTFTAAQSVILGGYSKENNIYFKNLNNVVIFTVSGDFDSVIFTGGSDEEQSVNYLSFDAKVSEDGVEFPVEGSNPTVSEIAMAEVIADGVTPNYLYLNAPVNLTDGFAMIFTKDQEAVKWVDGSSKPLTMTRGQYVNLGDLTARLEDMPEIPVEAEDIELNFSEIVNKTSGYTNTWEQTVNDYTWILTNFNNNNAGWQFVRCGSKSAASTATIVNKEAYASAISEVVVTYDTYASVDSNKLIVATDADFTNVVETVIPESPAAGDVVYHITTPTANCFYKLEIACAKASKNGPVQISKVLYKVAAGGDTPVENKIESIKAEATAYVIGDATDVCLSPEAIKVTATWTNGTEEVLPSTDYSVTLTQASFAVDAGTVADAATVSYIGENGNGAVADASCVLTIAASTQEAYTGLVGATDNSTGFHGESSPKWSVAAGESQTVKFTVVSTTAVENWNCPVVWLYDSADASLGFARMDNAILLDGKNWGEGANSASDWGWDTFKANIKGATLNLTVSRSLENTVSIRMKVVYANEEVHYQFFDGIAVAEDGASKFEVTVDGCCLAFGDVDLNPTLTGIEAAVNAVVYGGADLVSLSNESIDVQLVWSNGTKTRVPSTDYTVDGWNGGYYGTTYKAENKTGIATVHYTPEGGEELTASVDLKVSFKDINASSFGTTTGGFDWLYEEPFALGVGESLTYAVTAETVSDGFENWLTPQVYILGGGEELWRIRMDYFLFDIQDNWKGYGWGTEYVKSGNIDWALFNPANLNNAKIYFTVDNHNGYAWVTVFWQYYTDSTYTTLIEGNNTVFVNYGRFAVPVETLNVIAATDKCAVTFVKSAGAGIGDVDPGNIVNQ